MKEEGLFFVCMKMNESDLAIIICCTYTALCVLLHKYAGINFVITKSSLDILYVILLIVYRNTWYSYPLFLGHTSFSLIYPFADLETYLSLFHFGYYNIANLLLLWAAPPYLAFTEISVGVRALLLCFNFYPKLILISYILCEFICRVALPIYLWYGGHLGIFYTLGILMCTFISWQ